MKTELKITSLGSSSKGNCILVDNLIFDAGIKLGRLARGDPVFLKITNAQILLITHEHSDHVQGLKSVLKINPRLKIIIHPSCFQVLEKKDPWLNLYLSNIYFLEPGQDIIFFNWKIKAFKSNHNSVANNIYLLENSSGFKIFFLTDTGSLDLKQFSAFDFKNLKLLFLESNYSQLTPGNLKEEIQFSPLGHFSKTQSLKFLQKINSLLAADCKIALLHQSLSCYYGDDREYLQFGKEVIRLPTTRFDFEVFYEKN